MPRQGLVGCGAFSNKRHLGTLMTRKPGTPTGYQSKQGLTVACLKPPPQKDFLDVGSFRPRRYAKGSGPTLTPVGDPTTLGGLSGVPCSCTSCPVQENQGPGTGQVSGKAWSQERKQVLVGMKHLPNSNFNLHKGAYYLRGQKWRNMDCLARLGSMGWLGYPPGRDL